MHKKLLSLLLSLGLFATGIPVGVFAAKETNDTDNNKLEVTKINSPEDMVDVIHKAKTKSRQAKMKSATNSKQVQSVKKEETMRRVIFDGKDVPGKTYGAEKIYYYSTGDYYIIEYSTAAQAKKAVSKMKNDEPDALILQDRVIRQSFKTVNSKVLDNKKTAVKKTVTKKQSGLQKDENNPKPVEIQGHKQMGLDTLVSNIEGSSDYIKAKDPVKVAVIDSGINTKHEWFKDRIDEDSANFAIDHKDDKKAYEDEDGPNHAGGHGTHVSGIIAKGTPKNVKIMAIRVFDISGSASLLTITAGIDHARVHKAKVVNMSLGHGGPTEDEVKFMNAAMKKSVDSGSVLLAASGNENKDTRYSYPASSRWTISVGSFEPWGLSRNIGFDKTIADQADVWGHKTDEYKEDNTGVRSEFSNYGDLLDFVAPGRNIRSSWIGHDYPLVIESGKYKGEILEQAQGSDKATRLELGTSMATPHMSAAAADICLKHPEYNQWDVYAAFQDNSVDLDAKGAQGYTAEEMKNYGQGKDSYTGYGYVKLSEFDKKETLSEDGKMYQTIEADVTIDDSMNNVGKSVPIKAEVRRGNGELSFKSTDPNVVKVDGKKIKIVGKGECDIIATAKATDKYKKTDRKIKVKITKGTQEIYLPQKTFSKKLGDKPFKVTGKIKAPGDGKLVFLANENDVIDVSENGKVTIKGTGKAEMYAMARGTKNFNSRVSDSIIVKVSKAEKSKVFNKKVTKLSAKALVKKKVKLSWKNIKGISGYEISFSTKKQALNG